MIKITVEHPRTGVKQFEADGITASVTQGSESSTLIVTDYKKENFNPNVVINSLACLVDKTIRAMSSNKDSEALIKAIFLAMWEDINGEKMNKKIKKIKKELKKEKEGKRCQE